MTDSERLLAALRTGPKRADELYRLGMIVHSRAAELRARGFTITCERIPGEGARAYLYTLHEPAVSEPSLGSPGAAMPGVGSLTPEPVQLRLVTA